MRGVELDGILDARLLAGLHAFSTLAMTGLIWFVQLVHYPLMSRVPPGAFEAFEQEHVRRTTWIVAPLMLIEALSCALLAAVLPSTLTLAGAVALAIVWTSTFLVQVPLHGKLARAWDDTTHARLVGSNWVRTIAWSIRGVIATWIAVRGGVA